MNNSFMFFMRSVLLYLVLEKEIGPRLFLGQTSAGEADSVSRLTYYPEFFLSVVVFLVSAFHLPRIIRYLSRYPELICYLLLASFICLSRGSTTILGLQQVFIFTEALFALSMVILYDGQVRAQNILSNFFVFAVVANAAAVVAPSMSFMAGGDLAGSYRGLMRHRGDLGFMLSIAMIVFFVYTPRGYLRLALLAVCIVMLAMTHSAQGAILTIAGMGIAWVLRAGGKMTVMRGGLLITGLMLAGVIYSLAPDTLDNLFGVFGRDASFTGRTDIWAMAIYLIEQTGSATGHGFLQFTSDIIPESILILYKLNYISFGTTHSSYLEAIYSFGYVGGSLFFLVVARQIITWAVTILRFGRINDPVPLVLTFYCVVGGIAAAEKMFLPGAGWLCFLIAKTMLDAERRPSSPTTTSEDIVATRSRITETRQPGLPVSGRRSEGGLT